MSSGLFSGVSGLALGTGLYRDVSGLWSGASGLIAGFDGGNPYSGASLYLDFLTMTAPTFDSRITFSRGSNATLTDSTGKITYAPANLLVRSEEFDNASWTKAGATVTANTTTAPSGTTTADTLVEDTSTGVHITYQTASFVAGTNYTLTVYAKASTRTRLNIICVTGLLVQANFDLSAGNVISTISGTASISDAGNGWYRCVLSGTASATASGNVQFRLISSGTTVNYTGDGTSGIYLWGAQLEPVTYQTTPSTYQATTSTAYYGPRFDYDPVTLAAKGLLIEEQRTNLLLYSEQFDNAAWSKLRATVSANATTAPDGTSSADQLLDTAVAGTHVAIQTITKAASAITYAATVYLKKDVRDQGELRFSDQSGNGIRCTFNLTTVAVGTATAYGTGFTAGSSQITALNNGWYRISLTGTTNSATTLGHEVYIADAGGSTSYTGTGAGFYIWGAQLEAGAFATSYIPTVASTVTRSADVATMTGANFSSWYNQSQGTFTTEYNAYSATLGASVKALAVTSDGTSNNRIYGYLTASGAPTLFVANGGSVEANPGNSVISNSVTAKTAWVYNLNDFALVTNGGTVATDTLGIPPSTVNRLDIGNYIAGAQLNGHIRTLAYFNTRLSNAQLQALTS